MAEKTINVTGKVLPSDQRKFGRINDDQNNEYVVFETDLLQYFEVGKAAIVETREQQKKGKEGTYLVIENVKVNGEWKAKPREKKQWTGKGGWDNSPLKTRSMCLSYGKDLVVAGKIEMLQLLPKAQEFYDWVMKAAPEKPAQEVKAAIPAATPAATPAAEPRRKAVPRKIPKPSRNSWSALLPTAKNSPEPGLSTSARYPRTD